MDPIERLDLDISTSAYFSESYELPASRDSADPSPACEVQPGEHDPDGNADQAELEAQTALGETAEDSQTWLY